MSASSWPSNTPEVSRSGGGGESEESEVFIHLNFDSSLHAVILESHDVFSAYSGYKYELMGSVCIIL